MMFKFGVVLLLSLIYLNGSEAIKCYSGSSGSPTSPSRLSETQCQEDIVNCLKLVSSNEDGTIVGYQYQCGSHDKKENGCVNQDPSHPYYDNIDDDDMDEMMDKEMRELEKDTEEQDKEREENSGDEKKTGGEETTPQFHAFPANAKISKTVRSGSKPTSRRDVADWSQKVEDEVKRSKRETSSDANQHMFCYCDEDLCNGSTSLSGTLSLAGLSLAMLHILSRFY